MASRSVSRILCPSRGDGHLSGATVTDDLDAAHLQTSSGQLVCTGTQGRPLGLAPDGVYLAARVTTNAGGLLHHPFTLTGRNRRSTFCCTFPRVTPGGRYPPSCPVESGLSSTIPEGSAATARPTRLTQCGTSPRQRRQRLLRPLPIAHCPHSASQCAPVASQLHRPFHKYGPAVRAAGTIILSSDSNPDA